MLASAIVLITAALLLYTGGVFFERRAGSLRWIHAGLFGAGLAFDAAGTLLMSMIAADPSRAGADTSGLLNEVMAVTGIAALALMAVHLVWAVIVLLRNQESERLVFHRFSLVVWGLWLIPYFAGALGSAL